MAGATAAYFLRNREVQGSSRQLLNIGGVVALNLWLGSSAGSMIDNAGARTLDAYRLTLAALRLHNQSRSLSVPAEYDPAAAPLACQEVMYLQLVTAVIALWRASHMSRIPEKRMGRIVHCGGGTLHQALFPRCLVPSMMPLMIHQPLSSSALAAG